MSGKSGNGDRKYRQIVFSRNLAAKGKRETGLQGDEEWSRNCFLNDKVLSTCQMGRFLWKGND